VSFDSLLLNSPVCPKRGWLLPFAALLLLVVDDLLNLLSSGMADKVREFMAEDD
jgi:hypothetical protein